MARFQIIEEVPARAVVRLGATLMTPSGPVLKSYFTGGR